MAWQRDEQRSYAVSWFLAACTFAVVTVWATWDSEVTRAPWIEDQRAFFKLERKLSRAALADARRTWRRTGAKRARAVDQEIRQHERKLASAELAQVRARLAALDAQYTDAETDLTFAKSDQDEAYYLRVVAELDVERARTPGAKAAARARVRDERAAEAEHQGRIDRAQARMNRIDAQRRPLRARLEPVEEALTAARRERAELTHELEEAEQRVAAARALDFRDLQLQQTVVRWRTNEQGRVLDDVDRCVSCHMGVDRPGYEDPDVVPRALRTHPERAALLGAHPVERFGCTSCHQGQGRATERSAAHAAGAPRLADDRVSWTREGDPYWEEPLLALGTLWRTRLDDSADELEVSLGDGEAKKVVLPHRRYDAWADLGPALEAKLDAAFAPPADAPESDSFRVRLVGSRVVLEVRRTAKDPHAEPPSAPELRVRWPDDALRRLLGFAGPLAGASRYVAAAAPEPLVPSAGDTGASGLQVPHRERARFLLGVPFVESGCLRCHEGAADLRPARSVAEQVDRHAERRLADARRAAARGEPPPEPTPSNEPDADSTVDLAPTLSEGRALYRKLNCAGCHVLEGFAADRAAGPPLDAVAGKLGPDFLWTWLREPRAFRPGTRMPGFWPVPLDPPTGAPLPAGSAERRAFERRRDDEVTAIAAFLLSASSARVPAGYGSVEGASAEEGQALFESLGCRGCHATTAPAERPGVFATRARDVAPNLSRIGDKTGVDWLTWWIEDPAREWAATRMPALRLERRQAASIAAWLVSLTGGAPLASAPAVLRQAELPAALVARGKKLVSDYGCHGCHVVPGFDSPPPVGPELDGYARKDPAILDFAYAVPALAEQTWATFTTGKLDAPRIFRRDRVDLKMPDYDLSAHEIRALLVFLGGTLGDRPLEAADPDRSERGRALLAGRQLVDDYNCRGCHVLEGRGGDIRAYSSSEPEALALLPPVLRAEGWRVQPEWLYGFLRQPTVIRPWIPVRMPTFGLSTEQTAAIVRYLAALDGQSYPYQRTTPVPMDPERWRAADALFKELQCQSCHVVGSVVPEGADPAQLAPDLALVGQRLRPSWIRRWLENPELLMPGTRMPSYWPDPYSQEPSPYAHESPRTPADDIALLVDYLMTLGTPPAAAPTTPAAEPGARR